MAIQPYIPTIGELTQGGNPALGVTQPGQNYGTNEGLGLLFRAATHQANMNWLKHQEIEARKADVFKNIRDLSALSVMPNDREMLGKEMGEVMKIALDPDVFNGRNDAKRREFEAKVAQWGARVNMSKQDYLNGTIDRKILSENPEYQNPLNQKEVEKYWNSKLGEREYNKIIPTPVFDANPIWAAAAARATTPIAGEELQVGDLVMENGVQVFKLNPNGKRQRKLTGGATVDDKLYVDTALNMTVRNPQVFATQKPALEFQFQILPEEVQKTLLKPDGTIDYEKMIMPAIIAAKPKPTDRVASFDDDKFALEAQRAANAKALNDADNYAAMARTMAGINARKDELKDAAKAGDKGAQQVLTDANNYAENMMSLIDKGRIRVGGKTVKGISVNALSDEDKRVLGLIGKDGKVLPQYAEDNSEDLKPYYLYVGKNGGVAMSIIEDGRLKPETTKLSLNKEKIQSARLSYWLTTGSGKEYQASSELNTAAPTTGRTVVSGSDF